MLGDDDSNASLIKNNAAAAPLPPDKRAHEIYRNVATAAEAPSSQLSLAEPAALAGRDERIVPHKPCCKHIEPIKLTRI